MITRMAVDRRALPDDPEVLKQIIADQAGQIEQLKHYLVLFRRHRFGRRSEKLTEGQLLLEMAVAIEEAPKPGPLSKPPPAKGKQRPRRKMIPADLQRFPFVHEPPPDVMQCRKCKKGLSRIGEETAEQLEYEPPKLFVIKHIRPKYACEDCEANVVIADPATGPIEKGLPGAGLLTKVLVDKFCDHLPLYRQSKIWERQDVHIPESTLCGWVAQGAQLLEPIAKEVKKDVLASKVIKTDDTPIRVQDPQIKGKTKTGRLWPYVGDRKHAQVAFEYTESREEKWPKEFFNGFEGYLQGDFYRGYENICAGDTIKQVGCWAHARAPTHRHGSYLPVARLATDLLGSALAGSVSHRLDDLLNFKACSQHLLSLQSQPFQVALGIRINRRASAQQATTLGNGESGPPRFGPKSDLKSVLSPRGPRTELTIPLPYWEELFIMLVPLVGQGGPWFRRLHKGNAP